MWFVFVFYLFYVMWVVFVFVFVLCNAVGPAAARRAELVLGDSASPARLCKHRLGLLYSTVLDCAGTSHGANCFDKYICKHCMYHSIRLALYCTFWQARNLQDAQAEKTTRWQDDRMTRWQDDMMPWLLTKLKQLLSMSELKISAWSLIPVLDPDPWCF